VAASQTKAKATRSAKKATGPARKASRSVKKARPAAKTASSVRRNASTGRRTTRSVRHTRPAPHDAIAFLKADHRTVEKLFKSFEKAGDTAYRTKRKLVDDIIRELSVHAAIEEQFLYPAVRRELPRAEDDALEAIEEHHVAKWILSELERMAPEDERFNAKVTVLIESVRHHVREEEQELFREMRAGMSRTTLTELGAHLVEGKRLAPTRPHPRAPDEPPANLIVGAVAGVVDRARTAVKGR
jgi:hemerythrin superfamily protein